MVIRGKEWDGKSGAEVKEGLDGEGDLFVGVEWDVLHYTFVNFSPRRWGFIRAARKTDLVFAVHATGLNEHVGACRTSGQTWSADEEIHGLGVSGGFRKKACEDLSSPV